MSWTSSAHEQYLERGHRWAEGKGKGEKEAMSYQIQEENKFKATAITQQLGMKATSSGTNYTFS